MSSSSRSYPANKRPERSSSGLKPIKTRVAVNESDAASSTASPIATSRNSTSTMKVKSKEIDDTDIKKFRKSLTFKATPMPNFYKEPPPKPQLKKIPTTRAISPKLGRSKSNVSKSSEQIEIVDSPRAAKDQTMSPRFKYRDATTSKKPIRKSSLTNTSSEVKVGKSKDKGEVYESQVQLDGSLEVAGCADVDTVQESGFGSGSGSPNQDTTRVDLIVGS
ncbi:uncharacterized protein [Rutidosis leptorrhynchoides]|uniref:uncharacterized protein n=1 Tax=Rutidosis leptorrhynchoides TaxID=125765 RepID=UPI003A99EF46